MKRPDAELVTAACRGDVESFRELYERYYGTAVGIARSRGCDQHLAEDAAQEAFAIACQRLASLKNGNRFAEWLGTICRRTAIKMKRSCAGTSHSTPDPIAPAEINNNDATKLHQAVERLPCSAREVIELHYFSGLSYDEIGRVLRLTPQSVQGRLQRARRTLLAWLSKNGEQEMNDE